MKTGKEEKERKEKRIMYEKLYHISDIHIRLYNRLSEYEEVFSEVYTFLEKEKELGVRGIVVLTGDILHHKNELSPECILFTQKFLTRLGSFFPVVVIAGNHDALLNNRNRMDSLSAILSSSCPNISYFSHSGLYTMDNIVFGVFSLLDGGSPRLDESATKEGMVRVALYHGGVGRFSTNKGFIMEGISTSTFDGYDMVLLGDIHRFQYLDPAKRIAYAGSLISQNNTETDPDHGVLVWDVATRTSHLVRMNNPYAFKEAVFDPPYLVCDERRLDMRDLDTIREAIPSRARLTLLLTREKNSDDINSLRVLKEAFPEMHVSVRHSLRLTPSLNPDDTIIQDQVFSEHDMIRSYLNTLPDTWPEEHKKEIFEIVSGIRGDETTQRGMWEIIEVRFDNMFGYGKGNRIDTRSFPMHETIGIFGENSVGKSSLVEIIVFLLYGQITRYTHGASVPREVIRFGEDASYGAICFRVQGETYEIEKHMTLQKKTQKIRVEETLWQIHPDGTRENCSDEHRKKTDKFVVSKIGPCSQFLFTTIFLQQNEHPFRSLSPKDRKEFLYDILNLRKFDEMFDQKTDEFKTLRKDLDRLEKELARLPNRQLIQTSLDDCCTLIARLSEDEQSFHEKKALIRSEMISLDSQRRPCPFTETDGNTKKETLLRTIAREKEKFSEKEALHTRLVSSSQHKQERWKQHPFFSQDPDVMYQETWDRLEVLYKKRISEPTQIDGFSQDAYEQWKSSCTEKDTEHTINALRQQRDECLLRLRPEASPLAQLSLKKLGSRRASLLNRYNSDADTLQHTISLLEDKVLASKTSLETHTQQLDDLKRRHQMRETHNDEMIAVIHQMTFQHDCDACGHNHSIFSNHQKLKDERAQEEHDIRNLEHKCRALREDHEKVLRELTDAREECASQDTIARELQLVDDAVSNRQTRSSIQDIDKQIRECEDLQTRERLCKEWEKRHDEILRARFLNTHTENQITHLKNTIDEIKDARRIRDDALSSQHDVENSSLQLSHTRDHVDRLTSELQQVEDWLDAARENTRIDTERSRLGAEQDTLARDEYRVIQERMAKEHEHDTWKRHLDVFSQLSSSYDTTRSRHIFLDHLLRVIGRDGIPIFLVERYLPVLNDQMNALLAPFLGAKTLRLRCEKKKESVNIHIYMCTDDHESVYMGGMEGFIIDAVLKIVFARVSSSNRCNIFLIDEGISALDRKNMENLDEFFTFLEQFFPHVFLISHLREVQDHVRHAIHVVKDNGSSRLLFR
jgi:DNA repair exonuclease SbcCD ATPase subunit